MEVTGGVRVAGSLPLTLLSSGTVLLTGNIRTDADGDEPGAGGGIGGSGGDAPGGPFPGANGTGIPDEPDVNFSADGGGAGFGGGLGGSGGGEGPSDPTGEAMGGDAHPGGYLGSPLVGGSGGGVGGRGQSRGFGGGGGGAIQIVARLGITLSGDIHVSVGAGAGGTSGDVGDVGDVNIGSGGGGGSRGTMILETANIVDVRSSDVETAGGGGGAGASCNRCGGESEDGSEIESGDTNG